MTLKRIAYPSPNYSSRGGSGVRLVVVHTAQGASNAADLGAFFANPASGVSSHTGIDDTPNTVWEYVRRDWKSWTAANFNPVAVQTELTAWAEWTRQDWLAHPNMLDNCRLWIEEECAHFGIPKVKLTAAQAQGGEAGVCGHVDLGSAGGGHWDPGPEFPWDVVLSGSTAAKPPTPIWEEPDVYIIQAKSGWTAMFDGSKKTGIVNPDDRDAFMDAGVKLVRLSDEQYNKIPNA